MNTTPNTEGQTFCNDCIGAMGPDGAGEWIA